MLHPLQPNQLHLFSRLVEFHTNLAVTLARLYAFVHIIQADPLIKFILIWLLHALPELVYVPIISWIFSCIRQRMYPAPSVSDRTK